MYYFVLSKFIMWIQKFTIQYLLNLTILSALLQYSRNRNSSRENEGLMWRLWQLSFVAAFTRKAANSLEPYVTVWPFAQNGNLNEQWWLSPDQICQSLHWFQLCSYPDVLGTSTLPLCYSSVKCESHGTDINVYDLLFNIIIVLSTLSGVSTIHSTETKHALEFDKTKIYSSSSNYF